MEQLVRSVGALIGSEKGGEGGGGGLSGEEEKHFHDKGLNTGLCLLLLLRPPPAELRVDRRCTAEQMTGEWEREKRWRQKFFLILIVTLNVLLAGLRNC